MQNGAEDKKIRVGLVISQLSIGGAERQIYELAAGLKKTSVYQPVVICHSDYRHPNGLLLENEGILVVYLDTPLNYLSKLAWIRKQLIENHCRIAYAFLNPTNIYCWLACLGTGIRFIASVRGLPKLGLPLALGLKAAFAGADRIIANSESGKQWAFNTYKANLKKIVTVANAVRQISCYPDRNSMIRKELDIAEDATVIGLLSIVKSTKCPDFVIEVAAEFLKEHQQVHFIWVGDGPLYTEMVLKCHALPVEIKSRIHFVGAKDNVEDWFSTFNIFMLVSYSEGLSNSLMEAMSIGLPCVCSNVPGIFDLVTNNKTGILVSNNRADWTKALHDLVQNPELARAIGRNARQEIMNYSPQVLVERISAIFGQVLAKKEMR